jgi:hypothetical protein
MNHHLEIHEPHPHIAPLLKQYARDLAQTTPSSDLDARIGALVAAGQKKSARVHAPVPSRRLWQFAAAASFAVLAISAGILIGMKLEHSRDLKSARASAAREAGWSSADLTMWPSDSVSFKIPAEYSAQGTLVAVDPNTKNASTRYWIDVVVSNDGTFRIERIVPADAQKQGGHDGIAPQVR